MKKRPRKKTGVHYGDWAKPSGEGGIMRAIESPLPEHKEEIEYEFALKFVKALKSHKYGKYLNLEIIKGNDTSDLDFIIKSNVGAKYLELAEITPLNEAWGREAGFGKKIYISNLSNWILRDIIKNKEEKYNSTCKDTILLIYPTYQYFGLSVAAAVQLRSALYYIGCKFKAVFYLENLVESGQILLLHPTFYRLPNPSPLKYILQETTEFRNSIIETGEHKITGNLYEKELLIKTKGGGRILTSAVRTFTCNINSKQLIDIYNDM